MTVPWHAPLTPGIPDEVDAKSVSQLTFFLRNDLNTSLSNRRTGEQEEFCTRDLLKS